MEIADIKNIGLKVIQNEESKCADFLCNILTYKIEWILLNEILGKIGYEFNVKYAEEYPDNYEENTALICTNLDFDIYESLVI